MRLLQVALLVIFSVSAAFAEETYSDKVIEACKDDYIANCEGIDASSDEGKKCMRDAGVKLSTGCIDALLADGRITQEEYDKYQEAKKK